MRLGLREGTEQISLVVKLSGNLIPVFDFLTSHVSSQGGKLAVPHLQFANKSLWVTSCHLVWSLTFLPDISAPEPKSLNSRWSASAKYYHHAPAI